MSLKMALDLSQKPILDTKCLLNCPPAPFAMKLRKASQVKRSWEDDKMETVELKHHEFEKVPQEETPEKSTEVIMSEPIPDKDALDKDKKKKKKKVQENDLQGASSLGGPGLG